MNKRRASMPGLYLVPEDDLDSVRVFVAVHNIDDVRIKGIGELLAERADVVH